MEHNTQVRRWFLVNLLGAALESWQKQGKQLEQIKVARDTEVAVTGGWAGVTGTGRAL